MCERVKACAGYLERVTRKFVGELGSGEREWQSGGSALHFSLHEHVSVRSRLRQFPADARRLTWRVAFALSSQWMSNERAVFFCGELMTDSGPSSVVSLRRARGEADSASRSWCAGDVDGWKQAKVTAATKECVCVCRTRKERKERRKLGAGLRRQSLDMRGKERGEVVIAHMTTMWEIAIGETLSQLHFSRVSEVLSPHKQTRSLAFTSMSFSSWEV